VAQEHRKSGGSAGKKRFVTVKATVKCHQQSEHARRHAAFKRRRPSSALATA